MATPQRFGGTFAPPLTNELLAKYDVLKNGPAVPPIVKEAMAKLIDMIKVFRQTPASRNPRQPHPSQSGFVVVLETPEVERIAAAVPWREELDMWGKAIEALPTGTAEEASERTVKNDKGEDVDQVIFRCRVVDKVAHDLCNAALHLLWFGYELEQDREPVTNDMLGK